LSCEFEFSYVGRIPSRKIREKPRTRRRSSLGAPRMRYQCSGSPHESAGCLCATLMDEKFNRQICIGITSHKAAPRSDSRLAVVQAQRACNRVKHCPESVLLYVPIYLPAYLSAYLPTLGANRPGATSDEFIFHFDRSSALSGTAKRDDYELTGGTSCRGRRFMDFKEN